MSLLGQIVMQLMIGMSLVWIVVELGNACEQSQNRIVKQAPFVVAMVLCWAVGKGIFDLLWEVIRGGCP